MRWWGSNPDHWATLSDGARADMEAVYHLESRKCPCGCGNVIDDSMSREWNWDVQSTKCYAGAAIDQIRRQFAKENKDVEGAGDGLLWSAAPVPRN